jgi:hypothetical protein
VLDQCIHVIQAKADSADALLAIRSAQAFVGSEKKIPRKVCTGAPVKSVKQPKAQAAAVKGAKPAKVARGAAAGNETAAAKPAARRLANIAVIA